MAKSHHRHPATHTLHPHHPEHVFHHDRVMGGITIITGTLTIRSRFTMRTIAIIARRPNMAVVVKASSMMGIWHRTIQGIQ